MVRPLRELLVRLQKAVRDILSIAKGRGTRTEAKSSEADPASTGNHKECLASVRRFPKRPVKWCEMCAAAFLLDAMPCRGSGMLKIDELVTMLREIFGKGTREEFVTARRLIGRLRHQQAWDDAIMQQLVSLSHYRTTNPDLLNKLYKNCSVNDYENIYCKKHISWAKKVWDIDKNEESAILQKDEECEHSAEKNGANKELDVDQLVEMGFERNAAESFVSRHEDAYLKAVSEDRAALGSQDDALLQAAKNFDFQAAKTALNLGASMDCDLGGRGPLIIALSDDWGIESRRKVSLKLAKLLVSRGADINQKCKDPNFFCTPLMTAALSANHYAVDWLLKQGANADARDDNGNTVFELVLNRHDWKFNEVMKILVRRTKDGRKWLKTIDGEKWKRAQKT